MLDTIIARDDYKSLQQAGISISLSQDIIQRHFRYKKNTTENKVLELNPSADDYKKYGYLPNLTISYAKSQYGQGFYLDYFKLQCSVPKVLFGSSYFMSDGSDLGIFCEILSSKLRIFGIILTKEQIAGLSLSSFTCSYNILLPTLFGSPVTFLKKIVLLDTAKYIRNVLNTDFDETVDGFSVRSYSQNTGYGIYDKGSQLINNAKTSDELELKEKLQKREIPHCILRFERIYQRKVSIKSEVNRYFKRPHTTNPTIRDIFNEGLCKGILSDMTDKLGKTLNLISAELGYEHKFLPIEYVWEKAKEMGLNGHEIAFFTNYAISVGQMGVKATNVKYDEIYGRQGQKNRHKYTSAINDKLQRADLTGFTLVNLFDEIKHQINSFEIYKTEEQAREVQRKAENRIRDKQPSTTTPLLFDNAGFLAS